jgi:hypothetical protein
MIYQLYKVAEASIFEQNIVHPSPRFLYPVHCAILRTVKSPESSWCELDTHANTFVPGSNTRLLSTTGKVVTLHGFTEVIVYDIPIASIATVFVDKHGNQILLVVHQAPYLGSKHAGCLVNPNQLRHNGLAVHDCPCQFDSAS